MSILEGNRKNVEEPTIEFLKTRLNEIENLVFAHGKEKLDEYTKSILVAHLVENQKNLDEMKIYLSKEVKEIVKLKSMSAFMLRWGAVVVLSMILLFLIAWWMVEIRGKYDAVQQKSHKQELIENVVKYDKTGNHYFIDAQDYTVENGKDGGAKGIIIKSKSNETDN